MEHARNRVRALLPALEEIHPAFVENAARTGQLLRDEEQALDGFAQQAMQFARRKRLVGSAPAGTARGYPDQDDSALAVRAGLTTDFERRHVKSVLELLTAKSGTAVGPAAGQGGTHQLRNAADREKEGQRPFDPTPLSLQEN
jgi:hypothetical protein